MYRSYRTSVCHSAPIPFAIALAVFYCGHAAALGLGELSVRSHLGSRFHAEVRLIESAVDNRTADSCFRIDNSGDGDSGIPSLTRAFFRIERHRDLALLVITSDQTINEPIVEVNLRAGCGSEIVRRYTALIDPAPQKGDDRQAATLLPTKAVPVITDRRGNEKQPNTWTVAEGETARSIAQALFDKHPRAQRHFLAALGAENPQLDFGARGETPLTAGTVLTIPDMKRVLPAPPVTGEAQTPPQVPQENATDVPAARKRVPAHNPSERLADRLVISGNTDDAFPTAGSAELVLQPSTSLSTHLSDRISDDRRALLRVEYRLLNSLYVQAEQQLAVAEQIRDLEASFEALKAATDNAGQHRTTGVTQPPSGEESKAVSAKDGTQTPVSTSIPERPAKTGAPQDEGGLRGWIEVLAIVGLIGALAAILFRNSRKRLSKSEEVMDEEDSGIRPLVAADEVPPAYDAPFSATTVLSSMPDVAPVLPVDGQTIPARTESNDDKRDLQFKHFELDEVVDYTTVMELAEIMLSFGRIRGAAQSLEEFLAQNPNSALVPWLKLLEIYRSNGMREEYEQCSTKLREHFNVSSGPWESATGGLTEPIATIDEEELPIDDLLQRLPTIGSIPHLPESIRQAWDTPNGLAYLKNLLRDTRGGSRNGFPLPIARELLVLIDQLEARTQRTQ